MPHPTLELNPETLKNLARNLHEAAPATLGHPITWTQAQDLLAQTLSSADADQPVEATSPGPAEPLEMPHVPPETLPPPTAAPTLTIQPSARAFEALLTNCIPLDNGAIRLNKNRLQKEEVLAPDGLLPLLLSMTWEQVPKELRLEAASTVKNTTLLDQVLIEVDGDLAEQEAWAADIARTCEELKKTGDLAPAYKRWCAAPGRVWAIELE